MVDTSFHFSLFLIVYLVRFNTDREWYYHIVCPLPLSLRGGGRKFKYLPQREGGSEKSKIKG